MRLRRAAVATAQVVAVVNEAISQFRPLEIMNTDPGSPFTSGDFIGVLHKHHLAISMDGKGGSRDTVFVERLFTAVKYEYVYLHTYDSVWQA
jgi:putative transposase